MNKLLFLLLIFISVNTGWSQNNVVPIIYGVNLVPNNPAPESDKIADYVSLVKQNLRFKKHKMNSIV